MASHERELRICRYLDRISDIVLVCRRLLNLCGPDVRISTNVQISVDLVFDIKYMYDGSLTGVGYFDKFSCSYMEILSDAG